MDAETRTEMDYLGEIKIPAGKLWGAQTQRSLNHFNIGTDLIPAEMVEAYAIIKKAAAHANRAAGTLGDKEHELIIQVADEIISGEHLDMFPLHVWMTGSGTHFNMNVNEVVSNRCSQIVGTPLGSKIPVHPNDHVNMGQSSNDTFPTAISIAISLTATRRLFPAVEHLRDSIAGKADAWKNIIKIGRTHLQNATPITLGQEWSGYATMLSENLDRMKETLQGVLFLAVGGTAVGTGLNAPAHFAENVAAEIASMTGLSFASAPNKFAVQGSHDALVHFSGSLRTLAVSLFKIANDIRLMASEAGFGFSELLLPENEPGSSIMPGKINPTQAEALAMIAAQVLGNDVAVGFGGASGNLEMNSYKPLIAHNLLHSIRILSDGCLNFRRFMIEGIEPNVKKIRQYLDHSLMLVTALAPLIGYDRASQIAHHAIAKDLPLKVAAKELGIVTEEEFDRIVDPKEMIHPQPG
ncbi:MAG: class II fumarate hydratase [Gemmataceae bacterium]|jgi:fumarate hydratase class II|nr:class II fumarate hydratase [Gemmataceae bacterium]